MRHAIRVLALLLLPGFAWGQGAPAGPEDLTPPKLSFRPEAGATLDRIPQLLVQFRDEGKVNPKTFRAWFDGVEVSDQFRVSESQADAKLDMQPGDHVFMVQIRDATGNRARDSVAFRYYPKVDDGRAPTTSDPKGGGGASIYAPTSQPTGDVVPTTPAPYAPPRVLNTGLDLPLDPDSHVAFRDAALGVWRSGRLDGQLPSLDGLDPQDPRDESPPPVFFGEEINTSNDSIVYVIDISCSMITTTDPFVGADGQVRSGNRLDRAKAETIRSINGLSDGFEFNVVAYDCNTRTWQGKLMDANVSNKASAAAWVNSLAVAGGTGTGPAVALGLSFGDVGAVAVLTDGEPNCSLDMDGHRQMIRIQNDSGARIDVFGIQATGIYRQFCQSVASDNAGMYVDVP